MLPLTQHAISFSLNSPNKKVPISVADNWDLNLARETYRREHHLLMKARGVDFILCPTYPGAGVLQGGARYWHYSAVWNILDLPAAVLPSGVRCDRAVDGRDEGYEPRGELDEEEWGACKCFEIFTTPFTLRFIRPVLSFIPVSLSSSDHGLCHVDSELTAFPHVR